MYRKFLFFFFIALIIMNAARAQWKKSNFDFNEEITSIASNNGTLYASTSMDIAYDGNIFMSADGGATWKPFQPAIPSDYPSLLYVASAKDGSKYLFAVTEYSIYSIKLGAPGAAWKENKDIIGTVHSMAQVKKYGPKIYAAADGDGLYRSDDNGAHWINEAFAARNTYDVIKFTDITATDSGFYVATTNGLFTATAADSGAFVKPDGYVVSFVAASGKKIFAFSYSDGMRVSADKGQTWSPAGTGLENCKAVYCLYAAKNGYVFAGTDHGIFFYDNAKQSWKAINEGLPANPSGVWRITATTTKLVMETNSKIWYRSLTEIK